MSLIGELPEVKEYSPIFNEDADLKVTEELISMHAINPFIRNNSASRSYMSSLHISQAVTLDNGEERIIQTGLEYQFGKNTFSKKFINDSKIIDIVKRYNGVGVNYVNETTSLIVIFEDMVSNEIDYIEVPYYFSLHQYFGFKYKWNMELLNNLTSGMIVPAGTIIADSPAVSKNHGYKFGVNANVAYMSTPEVSEDGVVISESMAKKMSYKVFEKRIVEFGEESFPLNLYGDDENYKVFPEIGEYVNDDSVLMALRKYDTDITPALTSVNDVKDFNPNFDTAIYVKSPESKIVDIKVYYNPKTKKNIYTGTTEGIEKYVNGFKKYHNEVVRAYETLQKDHFRRYKNMDLRISERFQRLLVDAYVLTEEQKNVKFYYKRQKLDLYRMEFVLETEVTPREGGKLTTLHGSKGVIVEVRPDKDMPLNPVTGERADIIMDPTSIPGRMNIGNLYEQYFNSMSRHTKFMITEGIKGMGKETGDLTDDEISKVFLTVLGITKLLDTEQYQYYLNASPSQKRAVINEVIKDEMFLYYKVTSKVEPWMVIMRTLGTPFEPQLMNVTWNKDGKSFRIKDGILMGPQYIILLAKTPENFLSCASAKTNHYGFPIGVSSKQRVTMPWRNSPVRVLSETETRLYSSYVSRRALIEIKDRANSISTHSHICAKVLRASVPTNIDNVVDRLICPYGGDAAVEFVENILNAAGIKLEYVKDNNKIHEVR